MLEVVSKRQSRPPGSVSTADTEQERSALASYVGERIRSAMERRGWVDDEGKHDVRKLSEATGARWQTAQFWVLGENAPGPRYAKRIAKVLGMTLEELMGAATGEEPASEAWRQFKETPLGRSMTDSERVALAAMPWPNGAPDAGHYAAVLGVMRSTRRS